MQPFPLLLIFSVVSLSHQYQMMTTPSDYSIIKEDNKDKDDEVVKDAEDTIEKRCYTVDDAAEFCNAFAIDNNNSNERTTGLEEPDQIDLNHICDTIDAQTKDEVTDSKLDWRVGSIESQNRHFLNSGNYSDITFILGPDNDTQIINAHKIMLVRASPTFESILKVSTSGNKERWIRVTDISVNIFKAFLEYVYTGQLCFKNFDDACDMLSVASKFQMPDLSKLCHYHLWMNMYPSNLWGAYQCAICANDTNMAETALSVIQIKTEEALMDSAFSKIPQSTLVAFLQRNDLNVTSEMSLYEASLRWAMSEAERQGLPQEPESLRACLGPALQHIRFLTLTPNEFANIQYTSKILSYSESLAVIFNLNAPGVMPLPKNLSSNKDKRHNEGNNTLFFYVLSKPSSFPTCENKVIKTETSILDVFGTSYFSSTNVPKILSIKVPKRQNINIDPNCEFEDEDFTIKILDSKNNEIHTHHYKTECSDVQSPEEINSNTYNIKFKNDVYIQRTNDLLYKIKIIFHKSGRYPYSLSTVEEKDKNMQKPTVEYNYGSYNSEIILGKNDFVYSISWSG